MFSFKIVAVVLLATTLQAQCSVVHEPVPVAVPAAPPAIRYTLVAPQNVRPFAAQVSTFTKGLNVHAAPYAAGVVGGPAIVSRNVLPVPYHPLPAPAVASPYYPAPASPYYPAPATPYYPAPASPYYPAPAPAIPAYPQQVPAYVPYPHVPGRVPALTASPNLPATPAHLLPAPFARSIHAVTPGVSPAFPPHLSAAPLLG